MTETTSRKDSFRARLSQHSSVRRWTIPRTVESLIFSLFIDQPSGTTTSNYRSLFCDALYKSALGTTAQRWPIRRNQWFE